MDKSNFSIVFLLLLCTMMNFNTVMAQKMVSGRVVVWNDIPLVNVIVKAKKSNQETISNQKGEFSILVNNKDKLKFTAEGFISKRVSVNNEVDTLLIAMTLITNVYSEEEEFINDGFRHIPENYRTTAIKQLKSEVETELAGYNTVWDMIQGRCPGVIVRDNEVYIREGASADLRGQSNPAIIVIDGLQVPSSSLDDINPMDVKSVSLLKGAAAAIYGSSGGNGVVVIKTKTKLPQ